MFAQNFAILYLGPSLTYCSRTQIRVHEEAGMAWLFFANIIAFYANKTKLTDLYNIDK